MGDPHKNTWGGKNNSWGNKSKRSNNRKDNGDLNKAAKIIIAGAFVVAVLSNIGDVVDSVKSAVIESVTTSKTSSAAKDKHKSSKLTNEMKDIITDYIEDNIDENTGDVVFIDYSAVDNNKNYNSMIKEKLYEYTDSKAVTFVLTSPELENSEALQEEYSRVLGLIDDNSENNLAGFNNISVKAVSNMPTDNRLTIMLIYS